MKTWEFEYLGQNFEDVSFQIIVFRPNRLLIIWLLLFKLKYFLKNGISIDNGGVLIDFANLNE